MQSIPKLYDAESDNFQDTMTCHNENVGFRVPEYQRTYDWNEGNIKRLLEDCLNRFYNLSISNNKSYTFLGTLILVKEESESSFNGTSLSVVDGQQRLITLILLCCALTEELSLRKDDTSSLQEPTINWIKKEIKFILERLYDCVIGQLRSHGQTSGFPRVVRFQEDNRAFSSSEAKHDSVIAKFLHNFDCYYLQNNSTFTPVQTNDNTETLRFFQNYEYIKKQVELGIYKGNDVLDTGEQSDLDFNQISHDNFQNTELCNLFEKLDTLPDSTEKDIAISDIVSNSDSHGLARLMLFSHYVLKSVVLTRIETSDEDAAFDIFDSLNTTGEPLTAIETFKPLVMSFERESGHTRFNETENGKHFERLEENLNVFVENDKRQKDTKELLVTFALYLEGWKLPENLAAQRSYLREKFQGSVNSNINKRLIVQSLADIAEFRQTYWNRDSIQDLISIHPNDTSGRLKLCCAFISDMKTSLALPIMARYWAQYQQDGNEDTFADAVMALTAFLALRRSITGTTGGIDTDFRKMMGTLCAGLDYSNSLPGLDDLKKMLREYLAVPRIGVEDKETWSTRVCEVPLADHSQPLCRFLLFAASDNSTTDQGNPGLLTREDAIHSDQLAFLNFSKWQDNKYKTIEHVAPVSKSGGWDDEIYEESYTRHTIGNIILLPQKENSSLGNAPWTKKKLFYRALAAKTKEERKSQFEQAKEEGLTFPKRTENLLKEQVRLDMLDPIAEVSDWTKCIIQKRTENILQLAWDVIAPWLGY